MRTEAVVFDLDNTLYDSDYCYDLAERKLLKVISEEFQMTQTEAEEKFNNAKAIIKRQLGSEVASSHNRLLYMQNICEQCGRNPFLYAMKLYDIYWDAVLENMIPFDYVIPVLDELRSMGIKIGVLTDLTAHIQYRKIEQLGLSEKIDVLVTSEEAGAEKPSPIAFDLILDKLDMKSDVVLMVGDNSSKDINGAEARGMRALLFDRQSDFSNILKKYL